MEKKLLEERGRLVKQIEALQSELRGLDRAISLCRAEHAPATLAAPVRQRSRNVKETVLSIVTDSGTVGATVIEVLETAMARGAHLERGTVSSLLSRFKREGALDMRDGRYVVMGKASSQTHDGGVAMPH